MMNQRSNGRRARVASDYSEERYTGGARGRRRDSQGRNASARQDSSARQESSGRQSASSRKNAFSRSVSRAEYARQRKAKQRRRIIVIAAALVAAVCIGGVAWGLSYLSTVSGNLQDGLDPDLQNVLVKTDLANEPFYMLLIGTDKSAEREGSEEYEGDSFRSDSIMLARIDPVNKKVTLVSIHRDTMVDMGEYGVNKLNAAYAIGGASYAVEVVSKLAGVPISHYAEINFDGFRDIVNSLGGIEVEVPMEIDDADAGGYLAQGLQTLDGDQALILARARHAYDEFGDGDSYRAANQRLVLSAILKKALASDVGTIASTVESLSQYVTTDLGVFDIIGLAQTMRGLNPETDVYSAMQPTTSLYQDDIWWEITNESEWRAMMKRVDQGLPPTEEDIVDDSGTVLATTGSGSTSQNSNGSAGATKAGTVSVKNGTGITGLAGQAGDMIKGLGYTVETGNAESADYSTSVVVYSSPSQAQAAQELAQTLGISEVLLNDGSYIFESDFLVVIGADWQ